MISNGLNLSFNNQSHYCIVSDKKLVLNSLSRDGTNSSRREDLGLVWSGCWYIFCCEFTKMLAIKFALLVCLGVFVAGRPSEEKRLIKVSEDQDAVWMSEEEIFILIEKKTHFMDVTGRNFPAEKPIVANGNKSSLD